jgi:hypothetical protein
VSGSGFYWVSNDWYYATKNNVNVNVARLTFSTEGDINLLAGSRGRILSDYAGTMEVYNNASGQDLKLSATGASSYVQLGAGVSRTTFAWWRDTDCRMNTDLFTIKNKAGTTAYLTVDTVASTIVSAASVSLPLGSPGVPSLRWTDTDTGLYSTGLGNVSVAVNGTQALSLGTLITSQLPMTIDIVSTTAFVVKNGSDTFVIDTTNHTIKCHDPTTIHVQDSAAFVVRANDSQDPVMTIDTSIATPIVTVNGELILDRTDATAFVIRKDAAGGDIFVVDTNTPRVTSNAQLALLNGTAAAPSLRFADADTGFYASANGAIDVTNNGTQRMQFSANGDLILTAGSRGLLYSQYVGLFEIFNTVSGQNMQIATNGASGYVTFGDRTAWAFFRKSDTRLNTDQFRLYDNTGTTTYLTVNTSTGLTTLGGGLDFSNTSFKTSSTITLSSSPALTITLYYLKIDNTVHLTWKKTTLTGAATLDSSGPLSAIPSAFRPGTGPVALMSQYEYGGTYATAAVVIETTGYIKIINSTTGSTSIGAVTHTLYGGGGSYQL